MAIRVLLVDDTQEIIDSLRLIVDAEPDLVVVGEVTDGRRAAALVQQLSVDVALVDFNMPHLNGAEVTREILAARSHTRVIILTAFNADPNVIAALHAGASGFLLKDLQPDELPRAIRSAEAGGTILSPAAAPSVVARAVARAQAQAQPYDELGDLTEREIELITALGRGLSNNQIAAELFLSPASVKTFVSRLLDKLGLVNRTQAAILAHRAGLVD